MAKPTIYDVQFRTDIDSAIADVPAASPKAALAKARAIAADDDRRDKLHFEAYTGRFPVNEIVVYAHDGKEAAKWFDPVHGLTHVGADERRPLGEVAQAEGIGLADRLSRGCVTARSTSAGHSVASANSDLASCHAFGVCQQNQHVTFAQ